MPSARSSDSLNYRSLRFRLAALFVGLFGFSLVLFSTIVYSTVLSTLRHDFDVDLYNRALEISQHVDLDFVGQLSITSDVLAAGGKIVPFSAEETLVQIDSVDGRTLAQSYSLNHGRIPLRRGLIPLLFQSSTKIETISAKEIFRNQKPDRREFRMISYLVTRPMGTFILQVAVPTTSLERSARGLRNLLILGIPLALLVSTLLGLYFSGRALLPIGAIIEKAKQLSPSNLSERIPLPPSDDELRGLALTLNDLLDRLQQAFESQDRFIADASHELKTPLAILRGELDLMRKRERSPEEVSVFLASASQELDHLARLVEDLLLLARVDAGAAALSKIPVRLDEATLEVISRLDRLAQGKNQKLKVDLRDGGLENPFEASVDPELIQIVMKNLVENAIKFAPEGSAIEITLFNHPAEVELRVKNDGSPIPDEVRSRIFERFYRLDPKVSGAGLGLAIVHKIVTAHQGELSLKSDRVLGTTFSVRIKKDAKIP